MNLKSNFLLKKAAIFSCLIAAFSAFAEPADLIAPQAGVPRVRVREWGPEFEGVKKLYGQAVADRSNLAQLREEHIAKFEQEEKKANPDYLSLTPAITSDTINYINGMIQETIAKAGPPPTPFSLFTMGSMARDESGFYTDLEVGVLGDKKTETVKNYFEKFAQILADRLYLLGEHPAVQGKGLRIDEADNAPLHMKWFARYASPTQMQNLNEIAIRLGKIKELKPSEGSRIFLATPEEFASYLDPHIEDKINDQQKLFSKAMRDLQDEAWKRELQKPIAQRRSRAEVTKEVREAYTALLKPLFGYEMKVLKSLLGLTRNLRHLYGDEGIFNRFIAESNKVLAGPAGVAHPNFKNRRQEIVVNELLNDINKFIGDPSAPVHGKLDDDLDIKRRLYRWPEQILTNLSYWYDLGIQNGEQIIQELISRGLLNPQLGQQMRDLLNYATGLRLREQAILRKQGKTVPMSLEEWEKGKEKLEEELAFQRNYEQFALKMQPPLKTVETDKEGNIVAINAKEAGKILAERDLIHAKVLELQVELASYDKLKPLAADSIIQAQDIEKLTTTYLPILNELFMRAQAFILGDTNAFITSRQDFAEQHPDLKLITPIQPSELGTQTSPQLLQEPVQNTENAEAPVSIEPALTTNVAPTPTVPAINLPIKTGPGIGNILRTQMQQQDQSQSAQQPANSQNGLARILRMQQANRQAGRPQPQNAIPVNRPSGLGQILRMQQAQRGVR